MSEEIYHPSESVSAKALISNMDQYREMYERSIREPEKFWAEEAEKFTWFKNGIRYATTTTMFKTEK